MIYLDNAATTKPYPEVVKTITNVLTNYWGNASSAYSFGSESKQIIESVRNQIAADINCESDEIIFTSGGCEANSLAIKGFLSLHLDYNLLTTELEHASIINATEYAGCYNVCRFVKNDKFGNIDPEGLRDDLSQSPYYIHTLVSINGANSEIGTIQDIKKLAEITHSFNGVFHCDMTALYPHQRIDVRKLGIDMMTVSAQKFGATEGVGFLYIRKGIDINPIIYGTQENGLRGGSYNTALIAGMGTALNITRAFDCSLQIEHMRNKLLHVLLNIPGASLNGPSIDANRLPGNINITFDDVNAETLLTLCDMHGICISKGSACHSYNNLPSQTLTSIGLTTDQANNTIRITIDRNNTDEEINQSIKLLPKLIERIKYET